MMYLDHNATTLVLPEVAFFILPSSFILP